MCCFSYSVKESVGRAASHGEIRRSTTVAKGGRLNLRGICGGDVTVEAGGVAELWGVTRGSVRNRGGRVTIAGVVQGDVRGSGRTSASDGDD